MFVVLFTGKTREGKRGEWKGGEGRGEEQLCPVKVCEVLLLFVTAESPGLERWGRVDE